MVIEFYSYYYVSLKSKCQVYKILKLIHVVNPINEIFFIKFLNKNYNIIICHFIMLYIYIYIYIISNSFFHIFN